MATIQVIENLEEYDSVKRWIIKLGKKSGSSETRRKYLGFLAQFCKYAGMNPDELIEQRRRVRAGLSVF